MTPKRVSKVQRALTKVALEYAWSDLGDRKVVGPEFDRERDNVLKGGHRGYLLMSTTAGPEDRNVSFIFAQGIRKNDGESFLAIEASFFGVRLATDTLNPTPLIEVPAGLASTHTF